MQLELRRTNRQRKKSQLVVAKDRSFDLCKK